MSRKTKIWLIIATSLIAIGSTMFATAMFASGWDFTKLSTGEYETSTYEINEEFHAISVNTDTADITFAVSDDKSCSVICYDHENITYSVKVQDDALIIHVVDETEWYEHIGINFHTPKVTIYLSESEYTSLFIEESTGDIEIPTDFKFTNVDISSSTGDVKFFASASELIKIKTSTGDIFVENISAKDLDLSVSTGDISVSNILCEGNINIRVSTGKTNLADITCQNMISTGDTGDISLKNVIVAQKFSIERSTGDVNFDGCDANEIIVITDSGDVCGSFLTEKTFITQTDTGSVDVPKTTTGGKCQITTDTGDIEIKIKK